MHIIKSILHGLLIVFITLLLLLPMLKVYDLYLQWSRPKSAVSAVEGYEDLRNNRLYPYTGFHTGADVHHVGPMPEENQTEYQDFDIRSGDHGFWVDFDLDAPPAKQKSEYRIVFVSGSSGQGYGASSNKTTVTEVLERELQARLLHCGIRPRVINLAMAGSILEENKVALNLWAQKLEPDRIVIFSGGNDTANVLGAGVSTNMNIPGWNYREYLPLPANRPLWFNAMATVLPGIFLHSPLGYRLLGYDRIKLQKEAYERMQRAFNTENYYNHRTQYERWVGGDVDQQALKKLRENYAGPPEFRDKIFGVAKPPEGKKTVLWDVGLVGFVHGLKSIKRDFRGIPMTVAMQPTDMRQHVPYMYDEYKEFIRRVIDQTAGYYNKDWQFLDINGFWDTHKLWSDGTLYYGVHMLDTQQKLVAKLIARDVSEDIGKRLSCPVKEAESDESLAAAYRDEAKRAALAGQSAR
jgi:hypothetical protein